MQKNLLIIIFIISNILYAQNIVLNEVMSSNDKTIFDEFGNPSDWIELYNPTNNEINISGYFLSDDSLNIKKWQFGNAVIQSQSYLLVFASDQDTVVDFWHANFKISSSGETIFLSDSNGAILDSVQVPASLTDISFARKNDGQIPWTFQQPTPNSKNLGIEIIDMADSVSTSLPEGFYTSGISIELSAGTNDIYYTLDGSDPNINSMKFTNPIEISKTTVLKSISIKENYLPSPIMYKTYFISENTDLPVISLITDPKNMFDADSGIYTNYTMDWERPAHVEFFEDNKSFGFSENCGIEIYGGQSATAPQKSIAVKFKNDYGVSKIDYPLFPDFWLTKFKAFVLRNSGNDFQYTHIRDAVMQTLVKDLDVDYQEYRPATTFINGEYWGIYNIREKINEHYIANRHGVDPDNIDLLENNMEVIHGDSLSYQSLIDYLGSHDLSSKEAYTYLDSVIDLNEFILYFAAQAYYDNMDWPGTNIKFWRERSDSGKWRWILFGLDFGFGLYAHGPSEDHISFMFSTVETRYSNPPWATFLQRKLIENPIIRNRFINQIADLLNTNFKSSRVVSVINSLSNHISNEIPKHRSRWEITGESTAKMLTFANERPGYLRTHVRNYFNCGADGMINISATEGGSIQLNTLKLNSDDLPFSGIYFQGNELHVKAIPAIGYKFDGWSGSITSNEDSLILTVSRSTNLQAVFSIDSSLANEIVINEINYNSSNDFDCGDWIELFNLSNHQIDLSNCYFSDSDSSHKFIFPNGTAISSKGYLVLVENDSAFTNRFPEVNNYIGELGFGLSGSGEYMKLVDDNGNIVDSLTYDDKLPWSVEADGAGSTLELIDTYKDNSIGENWSASNGHGTPGKINSVVTSLESTEFQKIPSEYKLYQNYPNPFNPSTKIKYSIPKASYITLKIFDVLGNEIADLYKGKINSGEYISTFNAGGLSSGIYFCQLKAGNYVSIKKLVLLK